MAHDLIMELMYRYSFILIRKKEKTVSAELLELI